MAPSRRDENLGGIERLLELLDHLDWHVRIEAVPALAALWPQDARTVPALKRTMAGDPEWQVRDAAGDALAQIKSPQAYAALVDADAGRDVPAVLWPAALAAHHVSRFAKRITARFTHAA